MCFRLTEISILLDSSRPRFMQEDLTMRKSQCGVFIVEDRYMLTWDSLETRDVIRIFRTRRLGPRVLGAS